MSETHLLVLVEERESFLCFFGLFEIGEKGNFFPWLSGDLVSCCWFVAARFLCGFGRLRCVVMMSGCDGGENRGR